MTTIDDVARAAGVSISTVSYALSGKRSIRPDTRDRVLAAAKELGYLPHASARMLAEARSQILAVTAPLHVDTDDAAHMKFALEVTRAARAHNFDTLLLVDDDAVAGMERSAGTALADGIVVLDVDAHDARVPLAHKIDCPTVFIGIPADTDGLMCVDLDFEQAARDCVDRLVDAGHTVIGLISHDREAIARESNFPLRFRDAFVARADERGVTSGVAYPDGNDASAPVDELLAAHPDLTGIVLNCAASVAESLHDALARHGASVPADVSVIAGGATYPLESFPVPFDSIPLDARASCSAAVDLLIDAIERGSVEERTVLINPEYHDRGTVLAPSRSTPPKVQESN